VRHSNPFISAFLNVPEWSWKNSLRHWLAVSPLVPNFIQDYSPIKGYERIRKLQKGDTVVDAGAFPGDYTLFAARQVGPAGRVIALEPDPDNRKLLERNIRISGYPNILVLPFGLWNAETALSLNPDGVASTLLRPGTEPGSTDALPVRPLDRILDDLGIDHVDVLKMDIEGAEIEALEGASRMLETCTYACIASYHIVQGRPTADRVEAILLGHGFDVETGYPKHATTTGLRS